MIDLAKARRRRKQNALYAAMERSVEVALAQADVSPSDKKKLHGILKWMAKSPHPFTKCYKALLAHGWSEDRAKKTCATLKDVVRGTTKWRKGKSFDVGVSPAALSEVAAYFSDYSMPELLLAFSECVECGKVESDEEEVEEADTTPEVSLLSVGDDEIIVVSPHGTAKVTSPEEGKLVFSLNGKDLEFEVPEEGRLRDVYDELRPTLALSENKGLTIEFISDFEGVELAQGDPGGEGIWKPILRTGRWRVGPWSTQTKKVPMKVVLDGPSDAKNCVISLEELKKSFDDGAKQHVTVPLTKENDAATHKNQSIDNTGFIRKVKIEKEGGDGVLWGLFDFRDPEVREKAERGTLADVSGGIKFNFERKRDGKVFPTVLDHVAITNDPWIDGMKPFGLSEAEEDEEGDTAVAVRETGAGLGNDAKNSLANLAKIRGKQHKVSAPPATTKGGDDVADDNETQTITADEFVKSLGFGSTEELKDAIDSIGDTKADLHDRDVRDTMRSWEEDGVPPAVIAAAKPYLEQDDGGPAINLSTTVDGETQEGDQTTTQIVKAIVSAVPRVELSNRAPKQKQRANRPEDDSEEDSLTDEQKEIYSDAFMSGKSHDESVKLALAGKSEDGGD